MRGEQRIPHAKDGDKGIRKPKARLNFPFRFGSEQIKFQKKTFHRLVGAFMMKKFPHILVNMVGCIGQKILFEDLQNSRYFHTVHIGITTILEADLACKGFHMQY